MTVEEIEAFLSEHKEELTSSEVGEVRCQGHEFVLRREFGEFVYIKTQKNPEFKLSKETEEGRALGTIADYYYSYVSRKSRNESRKKELEEFREAKFII
jgi:hypothetical protein